jgi:hypothetical protein
VTQARQPLGYVIMVTYMSWVWILIVSVIVVGFVSVTLGRWLIRKGSEIERGRGRADAVELEEREE